MLKKEVQQLKLGIYRVYWKTGGCSVASVGFFANGERWIAPANWINIDFNYDNKKRLSIWRSVVNVELIEATKS
jgi:hypothetical protein